MKKKIYLMLLATIISSSLIGCGGVQQKTDTLIGEAGRELKLTATEFLNISESEAKKVEIDTSKVDVNKVGEYVVKAKYGFKNFKLNIIIKDSQSPRVTLSTKVLRVDDLANFNIEDAIYSVYDASEYEMSVLGYEKVAGVEEITDEYVDELSKSENGDVVLEGLTNDLIDEGAYRVAVSHKDAYENETLSEVYMVYVKPEVVEETKVETTNTNKNSNSGSVANTNSNSNTNNNSGSASSQPSAQSVGLPQYDNREYTSKDYTAINAGYYNVAIDSATGQYVVLVKDDEESWTAYDLLNAYLEPMGYEIVYESCRGSWINIEENMYLVSCGEIREITKWEATEDTDPSNDNVVDEDDVIDFN